MNNFICPGVKHILLSEELKAKLSEIKEEYTMKIEPAQSRSEKSQFKKQMKIKLSELTKQFKKENFLLGAALSGRRFFSIIISPPPIWGRLCILIDDAS